MPSAVMDGPNRRPVVSPSIGGWAWRRVAPMIDHAVLRSLRVGLTRCLHVHESCLWQRLAAILGRELELQPPICAVLFAALWPLFGFVYAIALVVFQRR